MASVTDASKQLLASAIVLSRANEWSQMAADINSNPSDPTVILQKILDTAREGVIVVNADMRISHCNVPAAVAFSRIGLDLENKRLSEVIRNLGLHEAVQNALNQSSSADVRLELTSGNKRNFDVHVAPIEIVNKKFGIVFFYETTQLDKLETTRQEFLSNISHELRTPLTSILAFVETLENGGINDKDNNLRFLNIIRRNAERMNRLIADILELSLIESGNIALSVREINLCNVVRDVMTALSAKALEREITFENKVPEQGSVFADPVRIEQILTNLIDNAIKFNCRGGRVTVNFSTDNERNIILVTDTGEGILAGHEHRIFERFYRADRARSREIDGTGLGLAIVKHLTRLHGGEITVSSALGSGTEFRIDLPDKKTSIIKISV